MLSPALAHACKTPSDMNEVVLSIMFAFTSVWNMEDIEYLSGTYAIYISAAVLSFPTQETGRSPPD